MRSRYAQFFDIDWDAPALQGRVLLPVLGEPRSDALAEGRLQVVEGMDGYELHYSASAFPLAPGTAAAAGPVSVETLEAQHYALESSHTAGALMNYRRFFDISSLAGLRIEDDTVFDAVLSRALALVDDGTVDGLRVDHIDGLRDPLSFATRLRAHAPRAWVIAEKILAPDEHLPQDWPIDGTTGYEFGALMTSLLVDPRGVAAISAAYADFTGDRRDFPSHSQEARRYVLEHLLRPELNRLTRVATVAGIRGAEVELVELMAGMPRYRIYPRDGQPLSLEDQAALNTADNAARASKRCDPARLAALVSALLDDGCSSQRAELRARFQQVAGAVMAKGVEDTAFYRYVRLVALNEVGADPQRISTLDDFHDACLKNANERPLSLLATTTHDTKRGEDARLRVTLLSEMPDRWHAALARLDACAQRHRGAHRHARQAEYLLYQTLVAAHPLDADRAWAYMLKASREAKQETSWIEPNPAYESDLERFVRGMVADPRVEAEVGSLVGAMTPAWHTLSLSQTLIKLTAPGVPDIYQGSELWDLRLVDPDNRTPVDYDLRSALLRDIATESAPGFMSRASEGAPKIRLIAAALALRRRNADAFGAGAGYQRLRVAGEREEHAICFARTAEDGQPVVATVAFRWPLLLRSGWEDTAVHLPGGRWRNVLTGRDVEGGARRLDSLLEEVPIALLERA